jgi:hypothetical protein
MHGSFPSWKAWNAGRASDFIWSEAQTMQELLVSFMGVSFEDLEYLMSRIMSLQRKRWWSNACLASIYLSFIFLVITVSACILCFLSDTNVL